MVSRWIKWEPIFEVEVLNATRQVSSTSPSDDKLTAPINRLAWKALEKRITNLSDPCFQLSVHSKIFKQAKVKFLSKSGRRDRLQPTSYRPIVLLFSIGKSLERLLARYMAYHASKYEILA